LKKNLKWRSFYRSPIDNATKILMQLSCTHPLTVIDRVLMPIVEKLQIASGNYGIVTFVARKSKRG
jgi:hypothetical protein